MDKAELKDALLGDARRLFTGESEEEIGLLWSLSSDTGEPKEVRKKAKKMLYMLRSKGIDVDSMKPETTVAETQKQEGGAVELAMLSLPDTAGRNLLFVSIADPKTLSLDIHQFLISRSLGIQDHRVRSGSRRSLEREVEQKGDFFPVPAAYAIYRLRMALENTPDNEKSKMAARVRRLNIREIETDEGVEGMNHPVLGLVSQALSQIQVPSEEKRLFSEKEIGRIALPEEDVHQYREKIGEAKSSRLIIDNKSPQQRVEETIDRFCAVYFTQKRREALCERLFDTALYFHHKGEKEYTQILVRYGESLLNRTLEIKKHPVVQFLTYRAFLMKG
jgi:hypothetical protein